ncbi:site-2 protease family protein [Kitasatospora cheerisanensis]|uniref:Membrane protein n=1 Tax=Kitasatospora cheerisanensis KCTC 2395 TaxID=1348663 RepID=A0A066YXF5_9ACTN|nr:site-2 protease family protein [Kitasatospora cheerisanensis]KDN85937.1 membrane protein [Kitasatospora cheerisanensis KCTC 2395]
MTYASTGQRSAESRVSPIFLALAGTFLAAGLALATGWGNTRLGVFLFVVSGWMVSLCLHEFAHARTALAGGDITVGAKGYLTLNPLKYGHVLLSFVLPVVFMIMGGIGLPGGAVYIERGRISGRLKHSLISAAGPLVNALFGVLLLVAVSQNWFDDPGVPTVFQDVELPVSPLPLALAFLGYLQVTAAILNLLPVPGLDGYGIIEPWLSYKTRRAIEPIAPYGMLLLFALVWQSQVGQWLFDLTVRIFDLFGADIRFSEVGRMLFSFWKTY